jgi:hypothetical protein
MVPQSHRFPAAPILQVSVIAIHRAIDHNHRNMAIQLLSIKLTVLLFYSL